jgi:hypothetical protein
MQDNYKDPKPLDSNRDGKTESAKVPLNKHPYNPITNANAKLDLSSGGKNVSLNVPPGGRGISGYGNSKSIGSAGTTGAHKTVNNESGRETSRNRVQGKVLKTTNHPNSKINGIYGG